jgi:hypothetical protein
MTLITQMPRMSSAPSAARVVLVLAANLCSVCGAAPPPAEEVTVWRPLGAWSGHGVLQTEAFISDTGVLRVSWRAEQAAPAGGTLRVSLHSAVSGRLLAVPVDRRGAGRDVAYVTEDPRSFYLVIESTDLAWSVDAAEGIPATRHPPESR